MGWLLFFLYSTLFSCICAHVALNRENINFHHEKSASNLIFVAESDEILPKTLEHIEPHCVPLVKCPAHVRTKKVMSCKTKSGREGVKCTTGQNHTEPLVKKDRHHLVHLDPFTIQQLSSKSQTEMSELRSREAKLMASSEATVLFPGPATYGHFRNSRTFDSADLTEVMSVATSALEIAIATRAFKDRQGLTNHELEMGIIEQDLSLTPLGQGCAPRPLCPLIPDKYRRIDGVCNNQIHTTWGAPFTPYSRLLPPSYQDGVWSPRMSVVDGQPLPSPRLISTMVISDVDKMNYDFTLMLMQFGQFLSHDFTQSIDTSYENGSAISCCTQDGTEKLHQQFRHFACMSIEIPKKDHFYSTFNQGCMNFVRSVLAPRHDCTLGYAQQMNKISHYIDASNIYGSTPEQTTELRSFHQGKLKVFNDFGRQLLPLSKDPQACLTMEQGSACFESGDTRTNQMVTLVILHTLFLREHNRIAGILAELNPSWTDEKIFLETRNIVIAEIQVIVYKEFLPAIIGESAMDEFGLRLQNGPEYSLDYDKNVDASITNEFATAAFRFGHSMVDGRINIYGQTKMEEMVAIPEVMFYPARMRLFKFMDQVLSTMTVDPVQEVDNSMPEALTRYMFRAGNPFGVDLASINIQRGRDHGLRPYNDYRELVGLPRIRHFEEFGPEIGEKMKRAYASVDDIDLWVGGLLEQKAPGSVVGYTFRDMIADQFSRLKKGDRYFFENDPVINPGYFDPDQLRELKKASMSRIVCDNSDGILLARQAPNAFRKPGVPGNEFVDCSSDIIPKINFIYWEE